MTKAPREYNCIVKKRDTLPNGHCFENISDWHSNIFEVHVPKSAYEEQVEGHVKTLKALERVQKERDELKTLVEKQSSLNEALVNKANELKAELEQAKQTADFNFQYQLKEIEKLKAENEKLRDAVPKEVYDKNWIKWQQDREKLNLEITRLRERIKELENAIKEM